MLDSSGRNLVQPLIEKLAKVFILLGFSANMMTIFSFIVGLTSVVFIFLNQSIIAVILLWISGLMDALDGTIARIKKEQSSLGTLMDICSDRAVEQGVIIALAVLEPGSRLALIMLNSSIVLCITIFLVVGTLSEIKSEKSFYYQSGLTERTETFIFLSLMIMFRDALNTIAVIFTALVIVTAFQRYIEALKILRKS
ncbi:MAG: CDP-alcohol phosphatidyltransferase family protein [Clostridia bacterium]|nr:CDP-alcohol phosphatidyltransferase family protein [Clostridia bacterium]